MPRIIFAILLVLFIAASSFAGASVPSGKVTPQKVTIKEILSSPRYLNTAVTVTGVYKGWGGEGPPPVTKSDYVIEAGGRQIYVNGPLPLGMTLKDMGKTITIKAKVKLKTLKLAGKTWKIIYLEIL